MRLEGTPLGADGPVPLSDVGVFAGPGDLDSLALLVREALAARELPVPGGPWPPVVEVGAVRGVSLAVDLSGAVAEAEAMARLAELGADPPWLPGGPGEGSGRRVPGDPFPERPERLAASLLDALREALPASEVSEWWDWSPPGLAFEVTLLEGRSVAGGVGEGLALYVHVSKLVPFCCTLCQRTLRLRSADTTVCHLVDFGSPRVAADAACTALGALGYRRLSLRQAMRPVGPPAPKLPHEGPTTLFDVLFGPCRGPYGKPSVTSRYGSAP